MKKLLLKIGVSILALGLIAGYVCHRINNSPEKKAVREIQAKLVKYEGLIYQTRFHEVQLYMLGEGFASCTGVLLKNDATGADILTAKHCKYGNEMYAEGIRVVSHKVSRNYDLALWKTDKPVPNKFPAKLASDNAKLGDKLFGFGRPILDPKPLGGRIIINGIKNEYTKMNSGPGCSGAGLFNENMEIVGILWGGHGDSDVTVFTNVERIKKFLDKIGYKYQ